MTLFLRTSSVLAALLAGALAVTPAAFAQEKTIAHVQGETTIKGVPEKVLTQDWAIFDDLTALGVKVSGVPSSNAPGYLQPLIPADAATIGSLFEPDFEGIAAAGADLYIISGRSARAFATARDIVPTIDLSVEDTNIVGGLKKNMTTLGEVFGQQAKAAELNTALDAKVAEVKAAAKGKGNALVLVTNAGKLGVYGAASRVSWIYNELGMPFALASAKDGNHGGDAVSFEFLREVDPDWVFVVDRDAGVGEKTGTAKAVLDNELFNQTKAAKQGHVIYIDAQAAYISMNGYNGLLLLLDQVLAGLSKG